MNSTNIKLIFRNFRKDKATSAINIIGFAFSISICFIIVIYVLHEFSYDKFLKNYDKIYRVINAEKNAAQVDCTIKDEILKKLPEVEDYCHLLLHERKAPIQYKKQVIDINYIASADNNFFRIFSIPVLYGNPQAPFDHNDSTLAISESISQKLFGTKNPIGEKVILFNENEYTISSVFKDFPERSSIRADIIRNEAYEVSKNSESHCENGKCEYKRNVFLILNNQADVGKVTEKIDSQLALEEKFLKKVKLQSFKDIYLYDDTRNNPLKHGNLKLLKLLSAIALITLFLACINYINLTIAQYKKRIKEVGVRKTIGASRNTLISSFINESFIVTIISIFFALAITGIILPFFSSIFNVHINISELIKPLHLVVIGLFVLFLGLINGFFPAVVITSFNPINLFQKRSVNVGVNGLLKNVLTIFQFTVSIILIIGVISIFKQLSYIKHKDLGFNDSYLLKISTNHITKYEVLKEELLQNSFILNACYSSGIPGEINWGFGVGLDAKDYSDGVSVIGADESLIETFQFEIVEGRKFLSSERDKACLINETALKKFGWNSWQGKHFNEWEGINGMEVVGLVKDFHFGSMYEEIEPIVVSFQDNQKSFLTVRLSGSNVSEAMDYIKKTWNKIEPNVPIDYTFYDAWFDSMYKKEEQLAKMVSTFAILAIVISCLGIFGQAILNTANRIKEIGIRKVSGAKTIEILTLLNKNFVKWVLIAFFIALPLAWYAMHKWLENFAYKTQLSWWIFVLAGLLALIVALLTVSWQSWRAARRNPVEALRYE